MEEEIQNLPGGQEPSDPPSFLERVENYFLNSWFPQLDRNQPWLDSLTEEDDKVRQMIQSGEGLFLFKPGDLEEGEDPKEKYPEKFNELKLRTLYDKYFNEEKLNDFMDTVDLYKTDPSQFTEDEVQYLEGLRQMYNTFMEANKTKAKERYEDRAATNLLGKGVGSAAIGLENALYLGPRESFANLLSGFIPGMKENASKFSLERKIRENKDVQDSIDPEFKSNTGEFVGEAIGGAVPSVVGIATGTLPLTSLYQGLQAAGDGRKMYKETVQEMGQEADPMEEFATALGFGITGFATEYTSDKLVSALGKVGAKEFAKKVGEKALRNRAIAQNALKFLGASAMEGSEEVAEGYLQEGILNTLDPRKGLLDSESMASFVAEVGQEYGLENAAMDFAGGAIGGTLGFGAALEKGNRDMRRRLREATPSDSELSPEAMATDSELSPEAMATEEGDPLPNPATPVEQEGFQPLPNNTDDILRTGFVRRGGKQVEFDALRQFSTPNALLERIVNNEKATLSEEEVSRLDADPVSYFIEKGDNETSPEDKQYFYEVASELGRLDTPDIDEAAVNNLVTPQEREAIFTQADQGQVTLPNDLENAEEYQRAYRRVLQDQGYFVTPFSEGEQGSVAQVYTPERAKETVVDTITENAFRNRKDNPEEFQRVSRAIGSGQENELIAEYAKANQGTTEGRLALYALSNRQVQDPFEGRQRLTEEEETKDRLSEEVFDLNEIRLLPLEESGDGSTEVTTDVEEGTTLNQEVEEDLDLENDPEYQRVKAESEQRKLQRSMEAAAEVVSRDPSLFSADDIQGLITELEIQGRPELAEKVRQSDPRFQNIQSVTLNQNAETTAEPSESKTSDGVVDETSSTQPKVKIGSKAEYTDHAKKVLQVREENAKVAKEEANKKPEPSIPSVTMPFTKKRGFLRGSVSTELIYNVGDEVEINLGSEDTKATITSIKQDKNGRYYAELDSNDNNFKRLYFTNENGTDVYLIPPKNNVALPSPSVEQPVRERKEGSTTQKTNPRVVATINGVQQRGTMEGFNAETNTVNFKPEGSNDIIDVPIENTAIENIESNEPTNTEGDSVETRIGNTAEQELSDPVTFSANRPEIQLYSKGIPNTRDVIGDDGTYVNILDEGQRRNVNLHLNRLFGFPDGSTGQQGNVSLDASGTGVGKTRMELILAKEIFDRTGKRTLIVTENDDVISQFGKGYVPNPDDDTSNVPENEKIARQLSLEGKEDEAAAFRRLDFVDIVKYDDFRTVKKNAEKYNRLRRLQTKLEKGEEINISDKEQEELGRFIADFGRTSRKGFIEKGKYVSIYDNEYGGIILDESQNLRDPFSKTSKLVNSVIDKVVSNGGKALYYTATPFESIVSAVDILSRLYNTSRSAMAKRLGLPAFVAKEPKEGDKIKFNPTASHIRKMEEARKGIERQGGYISQAYPFWGYKEDTLVSFTDEQRKEYQKILDYHLNGREINDLNEREFRMLYGDIKRWTEAQKTDAIVNQIVQEIQENPNRRIVVFAEQHKDPKIMKVEGYVQSVTNQLKKKLEERGITTVELHGGVNKQQKTENIQKFLNNDPSAQVAIATVEGAGVGVNLDDRDGNYPRTVIFAHIPESTIAIQQAMGRVSRRSTQSPSKVSFFFADESFADQAKLNLLKKKSRTLDSATGSNAAENVRSTIGVEGVVGQRPQTKPASTPVSKIFETDLSVEQLTPIFQEYFNTTREEAEAIALLWNTRAEAWAAQNNSTKEEWWRTRVKDFVKLPTANQSDPNTLNQLSRDISINDAVYIGGEIWDANDPLLEEDTRNFLREAQSASYRSLDEFLDRFKSHLDIKIAELESRTKEGRTSNREDIPRFIRDNEQLTDLVELRLALESVKDDGDVGKVYPSDVLGRIDPGTLYQDGDRFNSDTFRKAITDSFLSVGNEREALNLYRRLAMQNHPDRGGNTTAMQIVNEIYNQYRSGNLRRDTGRNIDPFSPDYWRSRFSEMDQRLNNRYSPYDDPNNPNRYSPYDDPDDPNNYDPYDLYQDEKPKLFSEMVKVLDRYLPDVVSVIPERTVKGKVTPGKTIKNPKTGAIINIPEKRLEDKHYPAQSIRDQVMAILKNHGIKDEEFEWSNLPQFLDEMEGVESVSKEDILNAASQNVEIEEIVLGSGGNNNVLSQLARQLQESLLRLPEWDITNIYRNVFGLTHPDIDMMVGELSARALHDSITRSHISTYIQGNFTPSERENYVSVNNSIRAIQDHLDSNTNDKPRWAEHTIPGGTNYREILITLPEKETGQTRRIIGKDVKVRDLESNYESPHFRGILNPLAHIRVKDRTDTEGNRVLFVEEVQSDWHQTGRDKGYINGEELQRKSEISDRIEQLNLETAKENSILSNIYQFNVFHVLEGEGLDDTKDTIRRRLQRDLTEDETRRLEELNDKYQELDTLHDEYSAIRRMVPDAPYKNTWPELAVKKLVQYAVENGYQKIAFTEGSKIQKIVGGELEGQKEFYNNILPRVVRKVTGEEIGKTSFDNILVRQIDNRIAADYMDNIVDAFIYENGSDPVSQMNIVKGETALTDLSNATGISKEELLDDVRNSYSDSYKASQVRAKWVSRNMERLQRFNSITITPQLREKALSGFSLFQGPKGAVTFLEDGRAIVKAFEKADASTAIHELGHILRRDLVGEDLDIINKWVGNDGQSDWTREQEEKFARGFERYVYEGKAPTKKLKMVFEKLKNVMRRIYEDVVGSSIDVEIPTQVREVFDRLFEVNSQEKLILLQEQEAKNVIAESYNTVPRDVMSQIIQRVKRDKDNYNIDDILTDYSSETQDNLRRFAEAYLVGINAQNRTLKSQDPADKLDYVMNAPLPSTQRKRNEKVMKEESAKFNPFKDGKVDAVNDLRRNVFTGNSRRIWLEAQEVADAKLKSALEYVAELIGLPPDLRRKVGGVKDSFDINYRTHIHRFSKLYQDATKQMNRDLRGLGYRPDLKINFSSKKMSEGYRMVANLVRDNRFMDPTKLSAEERALIPVAKKIRNFLDQMFEYQVNAGTIPNNKRVEGYLTRKYDIGQMVKKDVQMQFISLVATRLEEMSDGAVDSRLARAYATNIYNKIVSGSDFDIDLRYDAKNNAIVTGEFDDVVGRVTDILKGTKKPMPGSMKDRRLWFVSDQELEAIGVLRNDLPALLSEYMRDTVKYVEFTKKFGTDYSVLRNTLQAIADSDKITPEDKKTLIKRVVKSAKAVTGSLGYDTFDEQIGSKWAQNKIRTTVDWSRSIAAWGVLGKTSITSMVEFGLPVLVYGRDSAPAYFEGMYTWVKSYFDGDKTGLLRFIDDMNLAVDMASIATELNLGSEIDPSRAALNKMNSLYHRYVSLLEPVTKAQRIIAASAVRHRLERIFKKEFNSIEGEDLRFLERVGYGTNADEYNALRSIYNRYNNGHEVSMNEFDALNNVFTYGVTDTIVEASSANKPVWGSSHHPAMQILYQLQSYSDAVRNGPFAILFDEVIEGKNLWMILRFIPMILLAMATDAIKDALDDPHLSAEQKEYRKRQDIQTGIVGDAFDIAKRTGVMGNLERAIRPVEGVTRYNQNMVEAISGVTGSNIIDTSGAFLTGLIEGNWEYFARTLSKWTPRPMMFGPEIQRDVENFVDETAKELDPRYRKMSYERTRR